MRLTDEIFLEETIVKVIIINAILYTNEEKIVKKVNSVKDCMICDLCSAFTERGHDVTLIAAEEYKPIDDEGFPFHIVWLKSYFKLIFIANKIPFNLGIRKYLRSHDFDLIISSEAFSMDTFLAAITCPEKLIIWQEMAFHQRMAKQLASKLWHNVIIRLFYKDVRVVPRSDNAKAFISKYMTNVSPVIIQHGIDLAKFNYEMNKDRTFIVSSQLIARKRIDLIIKAFCNFCANSSNEFVLYIAGDGDQKKNLELLTNRLGIADKVIFLGKVPHSELIGYLRKAMAMLVYTQKDNSMISIAESIAVGTPVITTNVPDNAKYVKDYNLGIVSDNWDWQELDKIVADNQRYISNCKEYRVNLDNRHNVGLFIEEFSKLV